MTGATPPLAALPPFVGVVLYVVLAALTGWGQAADRQRSAEAGFDVHLLKPADPTLVCQLVENPTRRRPSM